MELGYQYHVFLNNCFLELRACAGWRIRQPEAYQLFVSAALISSFVPVKPTAEKKKGEKELKVSDSEVFSRVAEKLPRHLAIFGFLNEPFNQVNKLER